MRDLIRIFTPFLLAAIGGLYTELAGCLNIALEGYIIMGGFFSIIFTNLTGDLTTGIVLTLLTTGTIAFLQAWGTEKLKANNFITSLAVNMMAMGLTSVLSFSLFQTKGTIPLKNTPLIQTEFLTLSGILFTGVSLFLLYRTRFGLRLRAGGKNRRVLEASGIHYRFYSINAVIISALSCALAGTFLALELGAWIPNISAGRGWIALVIIYLGKKHPAGIFLASILFAVAENFSNLAQGYLNLPADFILAFPYGITLLALIFFSSTGKDSHH